ncbi:IPT/TIG domain-containing protein [Pandoraea iniqua]|uniref:IPT/TIG domain-containing protein n=1 Tax=Pandoraea iniqua TaxID=2508288 RepID=UPI001581BB73|nr:IPT/TIG domain-containing protein [Pandoraea iniqua]
MAPVAWFHWLRALLTLLVLFTASSSAWSQACVTWTPTPAQLSGGTYRYQMPVFGACDPSANGLYTTSNGNIGNLTAADGSILTVDLSDPSFDTLVFTPKANTTQTSWSFTLYQQGGAPSVVAIKIAAGTPSLTSVTPSSGPTTGNQSVTLSGSNFALGATVKFGGTAATGVVVNSTSSITATTPVHSAGLVDVVVDTTGTGGGGGGSSTLTNAYTFNPPLPTVTSLAPSGGPNSGGTAVTITGTGFLGATGVNFGASPGTGVVVLNDTTIVATSPAGTAPVDVTVSTSAGTSVVNAPGDRFTYTPTVTGVSPSSGPPSGGVSATITGTGFTNATSVTFGSTAALPYTIMSDTTITVSNVPAGTGTVDVKVTNSAGTSAANASDQFTYRAAPVVTSVTPNAGAPSGGASVRIQGSGFSTGGVPSVKFGSTSAPSFTLDSDTQITVTSPAAAAGTVDVTVTNNNGTSATSAADQFTYVGVPTVTSLGTKEGPLAGGTTVTINGTGLKTTTAVAFGAVSVPFTAVSDTQLTVTSPANASAGVVDIVVTTQGGTSATSSADQFTYMALPTVTSIAPTSGAAGGGTTVAINGSGFTSAATVSFGGTAATNVQFVSASQLTARSPAGTGTVDVRVSTTGGTSATSSNDQFTYRPAPAISGLSVTVGSPAGGTQTKITGTGFTGTTSVTFNGSPATTFNIDSDTQITVTSPAGSAGTVNVVVTTPNGTSAVGPSSQFTYAAPPTVLSLGPTTGSTAGGDSVTITGSNFYNGVTTVKLGGNTATITAISSTTITITTPAGSPGAATLTVDTPGGTSTTGGAFTYVAVPVVTSLSPAYGSTSGSTPVTISGSGFTGATAVKFGATAAAFTVNSDSQISATAPAGTGVVDVRVTNPAGTSAIVTADNYTYAGLPTVSSVAPAYGPVAGSTTVTISGTNFIPGVTVVMVGGQLSNSVTVNSSTSLTATVPAGTAGAANIIVTTPLGSKTLVGGYTYYAAPAVTSISPTSGPASGGTSVTITGTGFNNVTSVSFGGTSGSNITVNGTTQITATAPAGSGVVDVRVSAAGGTSPVTAADQFTYLGAPTVTSVTPNTGPTTGGTAVTVTGTGFTGATALKFGAVAGSSVTVVSATQITAVSPPGTSGVTNITVTTPNGTSSTTPANQFTYTSPVAVVLTPATLPTPVAGQAYNQTMSASGGTLPYRFTVTSGALPAGLTLNPTTGALTGTPSATGTSTFTISVTDASTGPGTPLTASQSYTFNITAQAASAPAIDVKALSNAPITIHATANAVGGPFTRVAIVTPPASGTAVVTGEDIVYTPAGNTNGVVTFAYALTNAAGTSAPIPVTVTVQAVPVTAPGLQASVSANEATNIDITTGATGGPFTAANVIAVSPANAGTATIVAVAGAAPASAGGVQRLRAAVVAPTQYSVRFVPAAAFAGMAVITYTLSNENATSAPGTLQVTVAPRKDPSTDPDVTGLIGAQVEAARRFATTQIGNFNQRLEALHGKGRAPSSNGLNVVLPSPDRDRNVSRCQDVVGISERDACLRGDVSPLALNKAKSLDVRDKSGGSSGVGTGDSSVPDLPGEGANDDKRFAYWTAGSVDFGFANMAANSAAQRSGFKFTTGGVTLGADYRLSDQLSLGAGVGYGHDATDIGSSGTRSTGDSYSGALYASFRPIPTLFVDAVAGFGTLNFSSRRWVIDANDFASGKRSGQQFFGSLSAGYEFRNDDWLFSPYGRLTASRSTLDQYSETGAGLNALTYFKQNVNTLSGTLGVRAGFAKATPIGTFSPYIRVELQHDFNGQSMAGLAYADIAGSGPVYFVPGSPYGSDRVQVGFGSKLRSGVLVFGLDYSVTTGMGGLQQGVRLTFTAPF